MKILLVEDNPADATLLMELLREKSQALEIEWVTDGSEAMEHIAKDNSQDLILLDLSLPRISGYEVLRCIKKSDSWRQIPVIILSTSSNPQDMIDCRSLGACGFLSKPSDLQGYEDLAMKMAGASAANAMPGIF